MQIKVIALALLLIASSLAGCTSGDPQTVEHDSRIAELEASQQELTIALAEHCLLYTSPSPRDRG